MSNPDEPKTSSSGILSDTWLYNHKRAIIIGLSVACLVVFVLMWLTFYLSGRKGPKGSTAGASHSPPLQPFDFQPPPSFDYFSGSKSQ